MSSKRLMIAVSVLTLTMGGVAFAESGTSGMPAGSGSEAGSHAPSDMSSKTQASPSDVKQAQQALKDQGLYKGQVDGQWGPETKQAVEQFQQKNGLKETAELDQQTMDQLQQADNDSSGNTNSDQSKSSPSEQNTETQQQK